MNEIKLKNILLPLTMILIVFKVTAVIEWTWWGVFLPVFVLTFIEVFWFIVASGFAAFIWYQDKRDLKRMMREIDEEMKQRVEDANKTISEEEL